MTDKTRIIVLRNAMTEQSARAMIEAKKTGPFRAMMRAPPKEDVHVHSVRLVHEALIRVSARYSADFFRRAVHPIKVDQNVIEVVLGDGVFPIRSKSRIRKTLSAGRGKNRVDLELEEHVYAESEGVMCLDRHGGETGFPYKTGTGAVEPYPRRMLDSSENVRRPEIDTGVALEKLRVKLRGPPPDGMRDLREEFAVRSVEEVYAPVYESRLVGPKKKVRIMRIDAARKKML
uniref:Uncharacterized protein n=1 Tax=Cenarchaeum symbiosum TaxID=46770 RepID=O74063_CENSM|nr:unknown [Cenarchaeum symbiosum]